MPAEIAYLQESQQQLGELQRLFQAQRHAYAAHPMPRVEQRRQWLDSLRQLLSDERQALVEAISQDFGNRSADETLLAELMPSLHGIHYARKHLKGWMQPARRKVGLAFQPASAKVVYQPLGVVGVIVPWNYPLFLAIGPLVGALSAGNRVMLKLSESTPATGLLLKELLGRVFPQDLVCVVLGEAEVGMAFSRLPFDHLLFTGATSIGRHVMRAAAENLTPVTLELGGKSPAIVSSDVPLKDAAERIAFGKTLNAGQTCVAPDYVLVPEERVGSFVEAYRQAVRSFYPSLADNPDYTSIINERQLARLNGYLSDATSKGALLISMFEQGQQRRMGHSLLLNVSDDMTLMQDEIFGPLLPIVPYKGLDEAFAYINRRPRPLALYYFGYNKAEQERVLQETHSGGVCLNDTLLHVPQEDLPFGGIGPSGMGHYHGHDGFLTFSKAKGVLTKQRFNAARLIYPPYGKSIQKLIQKLFVR
ncbi:coniferyl aldehyde dehydrogenase [Pseudomonas gingeri]|uniref:coniferyl aldehyde dehydrogenase n=1 Tax=Pseudomonas gingeri TaxID=117681 RepID=UPI0015A3FCCE|nr:coniferyl aldehyde dehydrogenase [Pseudomonas gingeri]NWA01145.1 coniferyl aldehyde dehydrogenase [Pseudomonas gingeri]NWA15290.1 coniferyl aldehyde dehydrogenase [Pseudomonas gingeri]NWA53497.1 coniferyl aldehyde dehydrogenase [Pseudomonas gingeri]NWA99242.1 coniferyl aldehyde dehydrogenase [Pseudomonas gingeri]NWB03998.1 coniferyl aldehyde dehydrogenase [Pseudomonas gingeri]